MITPAELTTRAWDIIKRNHGRDTCTCGEPFKDYQVQGYPHSGGWKIHPDLPKFWLYVVCPKCGYEWALWKLKIPTDVDFSIKEPVAPSPALIHAAALASEVVGDDELERYAEMKNKLDNTHWILTGDIVLFGAFEGHPVVRFIGKEKIYHVSACGLSKFLQENSILTVERER